MSDNKGDSNKQVLSSTTSPNEDSPPADQIPYSQLQQQAAATTVFLSAPLYSSTAFDQHHVNPKRQRYGGPQWKFLPPVPPQPPQNDSSTQSPTSAHLTSTTAAAAASSSETASPTPSTQSPSETASFHQQFRKGKYVSPVWKPNEMLCLARAWRAQYQCGGGDSVNVRTKTRAEKDREVADFLNRHGVNRDSKTAGTKWDNMLGEFRKVYDWEKRGLEREQMGKSYFRLSPYERKLYRLPASFDEEVFDELSQFMGSKITTCSSQTRVHQLLSPPLPVKVEEHSLFGERRKQMQICPSGDSSMDIVGVRASSNYNANYYKEIGRIGKVRMIWEESVSLWGDEEGEHQRSGRVRVQGSSFLNQDELVFIDDSSAACAMEAFEDGPLKGFSVDRFVNGQQVRVFGRKKPPALPTASCSSVPSLDFQDPTDYYIACLQQSSSPVLPNLSDLSWRLKEPPPEEYRLPLRKDVYQDLPPGKGMFFSCSNGLLDCKSFLYQILSPIIRNDTAFCISPASTRDSFIGLWDDCINRIISKFCPANIFLVRKPSITNSEPLQDQWPNVTGFLNNLCLWRGEETDRLREGGHHDDDPSYSIVEKLLWSFMDLPYLLGYYAVGHMVKFCALSRSSCQQDRINRTDLCSVDLSSPVDRLKGMVICYRVANFLPLLAARCNASQKVIFSDFQRIILGNGDVVETTPYTVTRFFPNRQKWAAVKEIYDILDQRIPHSEHVHRADEKELRLVLKPRGLRLKPVNLEELMEALKSVTKALVALHDFSFMHRDLGWDKVLRRSDGEWFVCGFDDAVGGPQINPHGEESDRHAPEMARGLHGVKVDVFGVGYLIKTCGLGLNDVPRILRDLQNRCMEHNPELRPTAADCYHHLLQVQSSLPPSA